MALLLYVGNLPFTTTADDLAALFQAHGAVALAEIVLDRFNGQSRGFGFVEMPHDDKAFQAINTLNGYCLNGRPLLVHEARPRPNDHAS